MYVGKEHLNSDISVRRSLTKLFGLNEFLANQISDHLGFRNKIRLKDLHYSQRETLLHILTRYYKIGIELKISLKKDKQRLFRIKSNRGLRLRKGLPVRGQRTHTNAQTAKKKK